MSDDFARLKLPVGAVKLLEDNIVRGFLALDLNDAEHHSAKSHPTGILNSDLIFDFDVHLLDKADSDFV